MPTSLTTGTRSSSPTTTNPIDLSILAKQAALEAEAAAARAAEKAIQEAVALKADKATVDAIKVPDISGKADKSALDAQLLLKADKATVEAIKIPDLTPLTVRVANVEASTATKAEASILQPVQDAIAAITADDTLDDQALSALRTIVDAIKVPDVSTKAEQSSLAAEITDRVAGDTVLEAKIALKADKSALDAEVAGRAAREKTFENEIASLTQTISTSGTDVSDRLASAEYNIGAEITNRTSADTVLDARVTATETKNTAQDAAIAKEVADRTAADAALQSAIAAIPSADLSGYATFDQLRTVDRTTNLRLNGLESDRVNTQQFGDEVTARINADTALGAIVDTEVANRTAGDAALGTRVTATETKNTAQDAAIALKAAQTDLTTEAATRAIADAALQSALANIPNSTAGGEVYDIPNMPTGGAIGTAANTIDKFSHFRILQSTPGQSIELPSPTNGKARLVTLHNRQGSAASVNFMGVSVPPGSSSWGLWSSGAWFPPSFPISTVGGTYNGLQRAEYSTTTLAITNADKDYTLTNTLQEGDLLEIQHMFNGNISEREMVWVRVQAGSVQRQFPWSDPTNNTHYFTFPNPLTNKFKVRQVGAGSSPSIVSIKVWRDAANGFVVPTGTQVRSTCNVSVNGAAAQTLFGGTSGRLMAVVPSGKMIGTVTASAGLNVSVADAYTGALEIAVTEGITSGTVTVNFVDLVSTATTLEVSYGNAGITNTTGTIPAKHPVSSKALKSISFLCADRRHQALTAAVREATTVIDMTTIRAVTSDSNGWRRVNRTLTLEAGADYPFTFDFRISGMDATRRSIGFSVNDSHAGQSNVYGEIRGITATYE
jgi:hypothetical protein